MPWRYLPELWFQILAPIWDLARMRRDSRHFLCPTYKVNKGGVFDKSYVTRHERERFDLLGAGGAADDDFEIADTGTRIQKRFSPLNIWAIEEAPELSEI